MAKSGLTAAHKAQIQEVADLILVIYETLAAMRYVDPDAIIRGPHDVEDNQKLDPSIIYLYSIMPYIDESKTAARDFFQGGSFFNQLAPWNQSRDPFYASPEGDFEHENGEYMYPWYTPLSNCANHSPGIVYDAQQHRIWIVHQIERHSTDPFYRRKWYGDDNGEKEEEMSNWGDSGESSWSDSSSDHDLDDANTSDDQTNSAGSSEFWDDEDGSIQAEELEGLRIDQASVVDYDEGFEIVAEPSQREQEEALQVKNRNSLEATLSRPAWDVLRDINRWYRELKELPGQGQSSQWLKPDVLRPLYLKNGWPDKFDGDQFEVDMAREYCTSRAHYVSKEPLRKVECYKAWTKYTDRDIARHIKSLADANTHDEEWQARFELWKAKERADRNARDLIEAKEKADVMCPGGRSLRDEDLPLWQLEMLRVQTQWKREHVQSQKDRARLPDIENNPELQALEKNDYRKRQLDVYEKAYAAAKADAERLCPGRTFQEATGIKSLGRQDTLAQIEETKKSIKSSEAYLQKICAFATSVPKDASQAKFEVERDVEKSRKSLDSLTVRLEHSQKWLAEYGNTD